MDHKEVMKRLRTNEALEEDLVIANKKITELTEVILNWNINSFSPKEARWMLNKKDKKIVKLEYIIKESIRLLEKSEMPL